MKNLTPILVLTLAACSDPAVFRPAKGVKDMPAAKIAYRVKDSTCDKIGFVTSAESIEDVAETTAKHGGTEYKILDDFGYTSIETGSVAGHSSVPGQVASLGVTHGHASSREAKRHSYSAEAYRCP